jgi:hypothetical protein
VRPPLLSFSIVPGDEHGEEDAEHDHPHEGEEASVHEGEHADKGPIKGDPTFVFRAELSKEALAFRDIEVNVEALSRDRKKTVVHLKRAHGEEISYYEASAEALPESGTYTVTAMLKGISKKGQEMEAESDPLKFELSGAVKKVVSTATPVPKEVHRDEPREVESFPLLPIVLISCSSVIAMIVGVMLTKKKKGGSANVTRYNPPKQMLDAIASLEQKVKSSDIKVGDVKLESEVEAERAEAAAKASTTPEGEGAQQEEGTEGSVTPSSEEG